MASKSSTRSFFGFSFNPSRSLTSIFDNFDLLRSCCLFSSSLIISSSLCFRIELDFFSGRGRVFAFLESEDGLGTSDFFLGCVAFSSSSIRSTVSSTPFSLKLEHLMVSYSAFLTETTLAVIYFHIFLEFELSVL